MQLIAEMEEFYERYKTKNHIDPRSPEEKERQGRIVEEIGERNLRAMGVVMTEKRSVKYEARPMQRVEVGEGVYCYVTDNGVSSEQAVMALHGLPGSCSEWAGIETEMKGKVRWINFAIPGLDGEDERRGNYEGDYPALLDLILKVKRKLGIKRLIACGHSYGSSIAFNLKQKFPEEVEGYINIGGLTNYWSLGSTMVYKACIAEFKYFDQEWRNRKLYNIDQERQKIHQRYVTYYTERNYEKYRLPFFNKNQLMTYIKLTSFPPQHQDNVFNRYRQLPGLRLVVYGKNDPLHIPQKVESTVHFLLREKESYINRLQFQRWFRQAKLPIQARLKEEYGITVEGQRIQQYFCFILEKTGHAIHKRRPQELARIIQIYLTVLQVLHQHSPALLPKL